MAEEVSDILKLLEDGEITPAEAEARIARSSGSSAGPTETEGGDAQTATGNGADAPTAAEPTSTKSFGFDWATRRESRFNLGGLGKKVTEVVQNVTGKGAIAGLCPSQQA